MVPLGPRLVFITSYRPLAAAVKSSQPEVAKRHGGGGGGGGGGNRPAAAGAPAGDRRKALSAPPSPLTRSAAHGQRGRPSQHFGLRIQLPDRRHDPSALSGCPAQRSVRSDARGAPWEPNGAFQSSEHECSAQARRGCVQWLPAMPIGAGQARPAAVSPACCALRCSSNGPLSRARNVNVLGGFVEVHGEVPMAAAAAGQALAASIAQSVKAQRAAGSLNAGDGSRNVAAQQQQQPPLRRPPPPSPPPPPPVDPRVQSLQVPAGHCRVALAGRMPDGAVLPSPIPMPCLCARCAAGALRPAERRRARWRRWRKQTCSLNPGCERVPSLMKSSRRVPGGCSLCNCRLGGLGLGA